MELWDAATARVLLAKSVVDAAVYSDARSEVVY